MGVVVVDPRIEEEKAKIAENGTNVLEVERLLDPTTSPEGGPGDGGRHRREGRSHSDFNEPGLGEDLGSRTPWRPEARSRCDFSPSRPSRPARQRGPRRGRRGYAAGGHAELAGGGYDAIVAAAAVSDYTLDPSAEKIKSGGEVVLRLRPTSKIIAAVRASHPEIKMVGFKAETFLSDEELISRARESMEKNCSTSSSETTSGRAEWGPRRTGFDLIPVGDGHRGLRKEKGYRKSRCRRPGGGAPRGPPPQPTSPVLRRPARPRSEAGGLGRRRPQPRLAGRHHRPKVGGDGRPPQRSGLGGAGDEEHTSSRRPPSGSRRSFLCPWGPASGRAGRGPSALPTPSTGPSASASPPMPSARRPTWRRLPPGPAWGDVLAQNTGGLVVWLLPGAPGLGVVDRIPVPPLKVDFLVRGPLSTKGRSYRTRGRRGGEP